MRPSVHVSRAEWALRTADSVVAQIAPDMIKSPGLHEREYRQVTALSALASAHLTMASAVTEYTHPDVTTLGVDQGWAEAEEDPARIDWAPRQAVAAIPFRLIDGRPVNPCQRTRFRYGRNEMGFWGEQKMADALVTIVYHGVRHLLMVERTDGYGWAVPGGHVEEGETGIEAALRELAEETGLSVSPDLARMTEPRYVPDPRASDEAWAVTIPVVVNLGILAELPLVRGGDDARTAAWIRAGSFSDLRASIGTAQVFAAHVSMLREFLGS